MNSLFQDVRFGWRALLKSPGFTLAAVLTLALGIGANSTVFSWINATLLNPIPGARNTSRLVAVTRGGSMDVEHFVSYPDYVDLRDHSRSFSGLMACDISSMDITTTDKPERVWGAMVSTNYFDVLEVQPVFGRGFRPDEEQKPGGSPVAVISYGLWQSHFAGKESAVGSTLRINQHPYTVVGVAPAAFQGSQTGLRFQIWIPLMMAGEIEHGQDQLHDRSTPWLLAYGRLKPGVSTVQAREETNLEMQQIARLYPESHRGRTDIEITPLWRSRFGANYYLHFVLPMLLAISSAVLLLACSNVANLLLVRSVSRRREIAIRLAMGASRARLVRQLLVESALLALAGGAVALLLTTWSAKSFTRFFAPSNLPISLEVQADSTVLLATLGASLLTGLMFGILPALRSARLTPQTVLKDETGTVSSGLHKTWISSALVVAQLAGSMLLLVCAGLFARSLDKQQRFDIGFNPEHVLLTSYDLFPQGYRPVEGREFHRQLLGKLERLPGVESATLANWVPLGYYFRSDSAQLEGYVPQLLESMVLPNAIVGPNYLRTMEIPLVAGRDFSAADIDGTQPVAIVNEFMAERYWPGQQAIGKRIYVDYNHTSYSVVGVARNTSYDDMSTSGQPFFYLPLYQTYNSGVTIHLRTHGEPMALAPLVEKTVHELNPNLPVSEVSSLHDRVQTVSTNTRIAGASSGAFGFLALVLAAVGIYGVIAYSTRQRTREIGIRMAVGAQTRDIRRLVLGQGMRLTLIGLAIGVVVSLLVTPLLRRLLFGVGASDVPTFLGVAVLLCLVALAACYIPARRAMKVDPMVALRHQ